MCGVGLSSFVNTGQRTHDSEHMAGKKEQGGGTQSDTRVGVRGTGVQDKGWAQVPSPQLGRGSGLGVYSHSRLTMALWVALRGGTGCWESCFLFWEISLSIHPHGCN